MDCEETIFEHALGFSSPPAREAYLRGACAGDASMLKRLQGLLGAHDRAGGFLEHPQPAAGAPGADLGAVASAAGATIVLPLIEKAGDRIGRYKLLQQIGEGGCGVVYMAEQEEPVRRRVALKIIKLGMDTRQVVARFEAERQALALMDHPNIAKVHDAGATATGRPYFVMELVRGVKITDFCDEKKLSTRQRLELFIQVCQAVQHAHQKGIIHRDLKPSNILVTINDGLAVPKVIDFGIAKATTGERLTDKTIFTAFEQFIGTPAYMSPEQAEITSVDIDTRSDIYSLGVLLYELLTGQTPFDAKELLQAGLEEMRRTLRDKEPARPSMRLSTLGAEDLTTTAHRRGLEPPKLVHLLRGDLDWIVMKCLEKDRARRYETANGLARDLQRHLSNEPVVARPRSRLYELQKSVRRHKVAFAATGAVILALLLGLGISTWSLVKERQARHRAVAAERTAKTEAAKSQQVAQFLKDMLQGVGPNVASGRDTTVLKEILDKTAQRIDTELNNQPEVEMELRVTIGEVYRYLGQFAKAEAMERAALDIANRVYGRHDMAVGAVLVHLTETFFADHRFEEAENTAHEALTILRAASPSKRTQEEIADALDALGNTYRYQDRKVEAENALRESLEIKRKLLGPGNLEIAGALNDLANAVREQGKPAEAEAMLRESLEIENRNHAPENDLGKAMTLHNLMVTCQLEGKLDEAVDASRAAVAIVRNVVKAAGDRPDPLFGRTEYFAGWFSDLGGLLLAQGKQEEAEGLQREALENLHKAANALSVGKPPQDPDVLYIRGNILARLGQWNEAAADLMRVRELRPSQHWCWHRLAALLVQTGDIDAYRAHCRLALERFGNTTDPVVADCIAKDCLILPSAGVDLRAAASLADTAIRLGHAGIMPWHEFCKGLAEYRQGHFAAAAEWMEKVLAAPRDPKTPISHSAGTKESPARDAEAYAVLAMARYQLKETADARTSLTQGLETADTRLPKVGHSDLVDCADWIFAHALLREAQELIDGQTKTSP